MPDAFISYRRIGSSSIAYLFQEKLKSQYKIECYLDVTHSSGFVEKFNDALMQAIEDSPVFICFLNKDTLSSDPVLGEIRKAYELKKPCIPVFQEGYEPPKEAEDAVLYLHKYQAVHVLDVKSVFVDESVRETARLIKSMQKKKSLIPAFGIGAMLIALMVTIAVVVFNGLGEPEISLSTETVNAQSTQNSLDMTGTAEARSTNDAQVTVDVQEVIIDTQASLDSLVIAGVIDLQIQIAIEGVENNDEWTTPYRQQFNNVFMVLVPAGCFMMGNDDGDVSEQPAYIRCLESPYWIDQYEVSNAQFNSLGGQAEAESSWSSSFSPRENVTWYEARDFCALRGARLPTEMEWEYVARGVDGLIYPWGDVFHPDYASYREESNEPSSVTTHPLGISWVGAYHMTGNVSEWVSSQLFQYPYSYVDGREDLEVEDINRVFRGGNYSSRQSELITTVRLSYPPTISSNRIGFRCARDFSLSDIQG